ncbi:hypothetical protein LAT59_02190, partial [Candidatus Gracilibacteria bacterium]|nr:hypothetical protein [Candidatus Gracilibacteria bacterium]
MFSRPKIFSRFPKLVSYVGTRDLFMRPRQFHEESINLQENVGKLEQDFGVKKAFFLAQCQSSEVIEITEDN